MPYYHVVFTLQAAIGDIAYQNKAVIYGILLKAAAETRHHRRRSEAPRRPNRPHRGAAHMGLGGRRRDPAPLLSEVSSRHPQTVSWLQENTFFTCPQCGSPDLIDKDAAMKLLAELHRAAN